MRDDFPEGTKRTIGARVAYRCSKPDCRAIATGPHSDSGRRVNIGVAAHISAASPVGPRFDPTQTSRERSAAANGIWLCQTCAKLVDSDEGRFPAEELRRWRDEAEHEVSEKMGKTATHTAQSLGIVRNIYRRGMGWSLCESKDSSVLVSASYLITNLTPRDVMFPRVEARFENRVEQVGLIFFSGNNRISSGDTAEVGVGFFAADPPPGESFIADLVFVDQLAVEHRLVNERFPARREG